MYRRLLTVGLLSPILLLLFSGIAWADAPKSPQDTGDTAFMLISAALVLLMTPGLAFFYGGFVRSRNVLNTFMMSFVLMAIVGVTWVLWGYSLSFAPGNSFIGGLQWLGLNGVTGDAGYYIPKAAIDAIGNVGALFVDATKGAPTEGAGSYSPTVPHMAFMVYQGMFAIITPALISGAIV